MHAGIVGAGLRLICLKRHVQAETAIGDAAQVKTALRHQQLPLAVDPRKRAGEFGQAMPARYAACKAMLKQHPAGYVEPPDRIRVPVISRPLAQRAAETFKLLPNRSGQMPLLCPYAPQRRHSAATGSPSSGMHRKES